MFRATLVAIIPAVLALGSANADVKQMPASRKNAGQIIPVADYGEARPATTPAPAVSPMPMPMPMPQSAFARSHPRLGQRGGIGSQEFWDRHECAPDGCPKPVGCGNFWSEMKFLFGSCRQFFGNGESTTGHHRQTRERTYTNGNGFRSP